MHHGRWLSQTCETGTKEVEAEVERLRRPGVLFGSTLVAALALFASGCGLHTEHGYVSSPSGSLSFRHPREWGQVKLAPLSTEWVTGVDAAEQPDPAHLDSFVLEHPFVVAQEYKLSTTSHDKVALNTLRTLALPDRRDPTTGDDPGIRLLSADPYLNAKGFEGQVLRFEVDFPEGTAVEQQLAVLDPARKRVQRVRVACSQECFDANRGAIDALFASVRLKP